MSTIGLCMIVKNEAKVILDCLASAQPLVDYILVVDTGSTDDTKELIRGFLRDQRIEGAVIDEPWRDFAYNRTVALERLREVKHVDYAMMIDADDCVVLEAGFDAAAFKAGMRADIFDVKIEHSNIFFFRPQICSNRKPFTFRGVLHEFLEAPPGPLVRASADGFFIKTSSSGARSQNPNKYQDDAKVLEAVLATETDPFLVSRYSFYLAQSYRDCGEIAKALVHYRNRIGQGYWTEEVYVSHLESANMMAVLAYPFDEVIAAYERAIAANPLRGEAFHAASRYCRGKDRFAEGMEYARKALTLTEPSGLFIQPWVYRYGLLDEFAVNAYWAGSYRESLDACLKILAVDALPAKMIQRIAANARFAFDKLAP